MKTGVHPLGRIWIPFSNGMTDTVRHLDSAFAGMTKKRKSASSRGNQDLLVYNRGMFNFAFTQLFSLLSFAGTGFSRRVNSL
jgi:hypothetical protein